ncbi:MAG: hypothetical protein GTO45_33215 [Candidatus Aminicenantes bacterium]|nr:hypothetical protein [Candidatus Aminicenantes bacterium]NIM83597.1 hypothetical protein [Candidatus Aminicenantes bacterium]NIN23001.1 hypothetical protein [Candidatus Aminicenantes bacterium]NIN46738.1 hypothetical protein [Candidatus Aminicenantes bacterium]NIN89644.1 hypothetical protein [Candidatus Aminicenantes bacterium]
MNTMGSLVGSLSFLVFYVYFIIPLAPIVYMFIKWRSYRDGDPPDSRLGMKVVLYYFKTLAYHVLLVSLAILFYNLLEKRSGSINVGLGLLVSGGVIYVVHSFLIHKFTNTLEYPLTARIYTAFNVIILGLVSMIAFIITITMLFEEGFSKIELPLVCFIIYTIAWAFQITLYLKPSLVKKISPFRR